mmetsp:Transcript_75317/g.122395  ORF Transcript_75317/g.122395 Transcript_75317/m.122395 type:complete len:254 (+) Transcript_75317:3279-4040(+)
MHLFGPLFCFEAPLFMRPRLPPQIAPLFLIIKHRRWHWLAVALRPVALRHITWLAVGPHRVCRIPRPCEVGCITRRRHHHPRLPWPPIAGVHGLHHGSMLRVRGCRVGVRWIEGACTHSACCLGQHLNASCAIGCRCSSSILMLDISVFAHSGTSMCCMLCWMANTSRTCCAPPTSCSTSRCSIVAWRGTTYTSIGSKGMVRSCVRSACMGSCNIIGTLCMVMGAALLRCELALSLVLAPYIGITHALRHFVT